MEMLGVPRCGERHDTQSLDLDNRGGLNRLKRQASKHIIGEGGDAEAHPVSLKARQQLLRTTSSSMRTHTSH